MRKPDFWTILTVFVVIAFVFFVIFNEKRLDKRYDDIMHHGVFTEAHINRIHVGTLKFGRKIIYYYSFRTPNGLVQGNQLTPVTREFINEEKLRGKVFPILYSSTSPENNRLLIFPEDFEACKLAFPDSLSWVNSL